jgi:hypothetical protein
MNQGFRHRPFRFAALAKLLGLAAFFFAFAFLSLMNSGYYLI